MRRFGRRREPARGSTTGRRGWPPGTGRTPRPHVAARVENQLNRVLAAWLRRRGWVPSAVVYDGYGSAPGTPGPYPQGWVRVLGRVVMARQEPSPRPVQLLRGWRSFLTAPAAEAALVVLVGDRRFELSADRSGVVDVVLEVPLPPGRHGVVLEPVGGSPSRGEVVVLGETATRGLVSDIDDTVIVTHLPRPLIAGWNTFVLRETARAEVPGMSALYRTLAEPDAETFVVYVSTGAWDTAPFLRRFLARHRFPRGPLLLTDWGPTNTGWFRSGREHKLASMRRLREEFPGIRWLLVGDDGQHDPELYSVIAQERPRAVRAVALRRLSPTEQVLARGLTEPEEPVALPVPVISGTDGHELADRLREIDLL